MVDGQCLVQRSSKGRVGNTPRAEVDMATVACFSTGGAVVIEITDATVILDFEMNLGFRA